MAIGNILRKMFSGTKESALEHYDEDGRPIRKMTMDEKRLEILMRRKYLQAVRSKADIMEKQQWKEMTSHEMPYHKKYRKLNRR